MAGSDSYHDENGVLYNKLGITDAKELSDIEYIITASRAVDWELKPHPALNFDLDRQKAIHRHLFEPIYEWAGKQRTTSLNKGVPNTKLISVFQEPSVIESGWRDLETRINSFLTGPSKDFSAKREQLLDIFISANSLHPFAEGNGRSLQVFMRDLARTQEIVIDYTKVSKTDWNIASAMSGQLARRFEGDHFHYPSDRTRIRKVYEDIVSPAAQRATPAELPYVMDERHQQQFQAIANKELAQRPTAGTVANLASSPATAAISPPVPSSEAMAPRSVQRLLVMNRQKILQTQKAGEKDWQTLAVVESSAQPGFYYLESARLADKTATSDGQFIHNDHKFLYQQCGTTLVKHELSAFDQKPVEGSIGRVRYQKGNAIVEGLKNVHKHRL